MEYLISEEGSSIAKTKREITQAHDSFSVYRGSVASYSWVTIKQPFCDWLIFNSMSTCLGLFYAYRCKITLDRLTFINNSSQLSTW